MSKASLKILHNYIKCNRNAKHIKEEHPEFPEIIPEPEEKSE